MTDEAKAENEACQAVIAEFKAILVQAGISQPIVEMCQQLEHRIELRRLLDKSPSERLNYEQLSRRFG